MNGVPDMSKIFSANDDIDIARACRDLCMSAMVLAPLLHPDTEPDSIAAAQRAAIMAVWDEMGSWVSIDVVSERVCLPVSVVERRIAEINANTARECVA